MITFVDISMRVDSVIQRTNIFQVSRTSRFHGMPKLK